MTPGARVAAAIGILDRIIAGTPAEQALTGWARASRYAGSGDRAAVRDLVFGALRQRRTLLARSGSAELTGRALMIGRSAVDGQDPAILFSGLGHAPAPLSDDEHSCLSKAGAQALPDLVALDCPDWIAPSLRRALGDGMAPVLTSMRGRAPVFLRVNPGRVTRAAAIAGLVCDGIACRPVDDVKTALEVTENESRIKHSKAYASGHVELQDLSPQAAVAALDLTPELHVLDYCAGGGGKALAIAARGVRHVTAHDANPGRMSDLAARAERAGAEIEIATPAALAGRRFDLVVTDVPCSGTGTWRRSPDAKWRLTRDRLDQLCQLQAVILDAATAHVAPGGCLVYMTCSLLCEENRDQIDSFLDRTEGWRLIADRLYTPLSGGDGFYSAHLTRAPSDA